MHRTFQKLPPILEEPSESKGEWPAACLSPPEWVESPASTRSDLTFDLISARSDLSQDSGSSTLNSAIQSQPCNGACIYCGDSTQGVDWGLDMCSACSSALESGCPPEINLRCAQCIESIEGNYVEALGSVWHPSCFSCLRCGTQVQQGFIIDGHLFCSLCHNENSRCGICADPVAGLCLSSPTARFHPYHFNCQQCQDPLSSSGFSAVGGEILCAECANPADDSTLVPLCFELSL